MLLIVGLAVAVNSGCSTVDTKSFRYLEAPNEPATDPSQVEILSHPPARPFIKLGRIDAVPRGDVDNEKIKDAIRKEAAKMGADAVILGYEGQGPGGFSIQGMPGDMEARRETNRVVVATAIKFGGEGERGERLLRFREGR